jgi:hypothetical protein
MLGLAGGAPLRIEGQAHHQHLHPPLVHQGQQLGQVPRQGAPGQGWQWRDGETEAITAGQADPPLAHIEGQG